MQWMKRPGCSGAWCVQISSHKSFKRQRVPRGSYKNRPPRLEISCNNSRALLIKVRKCTKRKEPSPQTQCFNNEGNGTWIQSIPQPWACFMTFLTMGSVRYFSSTDWFVSGHVLQSFLLIYLYIYIEIYSLLGQYSIWDNFETTPNEIKWRSCDSGLQSWLHVRTYQD